MSRNNRGRRCLTAKEVLDGLDNSSGLEFSDDSSDNDDDSSDNDTDGEGD